MAKSDGGIGHMPGTPLDLDLGASGIRADGRTIRAAGEKPPVFDRKPGMDIAAGFGDQGINLGLEILERHGEYSFYQQIFGGPPIPSSGISS